MDETSATLWCTGNSSIHARLRLSAIHSTLGAGGEIMSRIDEAIAYMLKTACTPYAAALHVSINPSALYRAIEVRNAQIKCKCCGSVIRKVKTD